MSQHTFADRNPRTAQILSTLANGLPDVLDYGINGGQGNANQNTERTPPQDTTTVPAQPPPQAPVLNVPNRALLIGGALAVGLVLFLMRR